MKGLKVILSLLGFAILIFSGNIFAQGKEHKISAEEKAWMDYMTPGKMQQHFKSQVGDWTYVSKFWMDPNNKEPMVTKGTSKFETIFGGRYLKMTHEGKMMGRPFNGFGLTGYDNAKKVYQSIWVDNMGTGIMYMTGNYKDGKLILSGNSPDPAAGKDITMKEVTSDIDKNHFLLEMYKVTPKGDIKTMEITYTRAK